LEEADQAEITLWCLILGIVKGERRAKTKLPSLTDQGLSRFVNIILTARKKISKEAINLPDLIKMIVNKTDYKTWLHDHHGDVTEARWANVEELITQATDYQELISCGFEDDSLPEIDGLRQTEDADHLSRFLANVTLASEVRNEETEGGPIAQVTISTIHAAKGLEWPVVFIPATYQGSIPHSRADDIDEERRIFYVAMTRAKALLYMSCPLKNSQSEETTLSPFLTPPPLTPLLDKQGPSISSTLVQTLALILRRTPPSALSISKSSALLQSSEDSVFPLDGAEDKEKESRWNSFDGNPTYSMGQPGAKRRRIELGKSASNLEEGPSASWKPAYSTTMDKAASFTAASVIVSSGFVSAGSHMQVLKEQSVNCVAEQLAALDESKEQPPKKSGKGKSRLPDGQGTLFSFLGKSEPQPQAPEPRGKAHSELAKLQLPSRSINEPRKFLPRNEPPSIEPSLAQHRLGARLDTRPKQNLIVEHHNQNNYPFLSSSPPRKRALEEPMEKSAGLVAQPPLMPLIRPALTTHTTTMSLLQSSNSTSKTYGVKRSMDGWKNRSARPFKPPTMKRPQ
jgi:DNA helicase-2/ATP-dependent DNA helicase PcrA